MSDDEVLAILSNLDTRKLSTRFISQNQDLNTPTARILLNIILIAVVSAILKHTYSLDRLVQQVGNAIFNLGILQPTLHIELNAKFFKFRSFVFIVSAGHASASHELLHALRLVASHCGKKCGCGPHCAVPDQSVHSEFGGSSGISKPPNISVFNVNSNLYTLT